jgi:hypothetical protein
MNSSTVSFSQQFIAALESRNAEVHSNDTLTALSNARRSAVALDKVMSLPAFAEVAPELLRRVRIANPNSDKLNFIAVKVLVKIVSTLQALATQLRSDLDPYTNAIGANLINLHQITNKSNLVCLSKSIAYNALDEVQMLKVKRDCTPGTASTQSSSTRMTLHYLGIAEVRKAHAGDVMKLYDNDRAKLFASIFAPAKVLTSADEKNEQQTPAEAPADVPQTQPEAVMPAAVADPQTPDVTAQVHDDSAEVSDLINSLIAEADELHDDSEQRQLINEQLSESPSMSEPIDNAAPVSAEGSSVQPESQQNKGKGKRSNKR